MNKSLREITETNTDSFLVWLVICVSLQSA